MQWSDSSSFKGLWENDQRKYGVLKLKKEQKKYEANFKNDVFHGWGRLSMIK